MKIMYKTSTPTRIYELYMYVYYTQIKILTLRFTPKIIEIERPSFIFTTADPDVHIILCNNICIDVIAIINKNGKG